jgi:hypothetical protein
LKSASVISTAAKGSFIAPICSSDSKLVNVMTRPQLVRMRCYTTKQSAHQCGAVSRLCECCKSATVLRGNPTKKLAHDIDAWADHYGAQLSPADGGCGLCSIVRRNRVSFSARAVTSADNYDRGWYAARTDVHGRRTRQSRPFAMPIPLIPHASVSTSAEFASIWNVSVQPTLNRRTGE